MARGVGVPVSGIALDWSKCYDHVVIDLLEDIARAAQVPAEITKPMLAAYRQPRRALLKSVVGSARSPSNGLPPGCPGATDWVALLIHLLTTELRNAGASVSVRAYVDDVTATTQGAEHACSVVSLSLIHI